MRSPEEFLNKDEKFDKEKMIKKIPKEMREKMDKKYEYKKEKDTKSDDEKLSFIKPSKKPESGAGALARKQEDDYYTTLDATSSDAKNKKGKLTIEKKVYRPREQ